MCLVNGVCLVGVVIYVLVLKKWDWYDMSVVKEFLEKDRLNLFNKVVMIILWNNWFWISLVFFFLGCFRIFR